MLMSKTAVESSGDVNVRVASHLSNLPAMATDAFTSNCIVLSTGVIAKTGACVRPRDGSTADTTRPRVASRMPVSLTFCCFIVILCPFTTQHSELGLKIVASVALGMISPGDHVKHCGLYICFMGTLLVELSFLTVGAQLAQTLKAVARDVRWERRRSLTSGPVFENILEVSCRNLVCRFGIQVDLEAFQSALIKANQSGTCGIQIGDKGDNNRNGDGNENECQPKASRERQTARENRNHRDGDNQEPDGPRNAVLPGSNSFLVKIDRLVQGIDVNGSHCTAIDLSDGTRVDPELLLNPLRVIDGFGEAIGIKSCVAELEARINVLSQKVPRVLTIRRRERTGTKIGGAD